MKFLPPPLNVWSLFLTFILYLDGYEYRLLAKIRKISVRYNVSARTLHYYEDMGLIESTRSDDYAYRLYDEAAVKRLEQILILRRLNISIKDIKRIFNTTGSEVVLDVLEKKDDDIDEEISLLYELKNIVLEFID